MARSDSHHASLLPCRFPSRYVGSRYDPNAEQPSNCPHWNPGPGDYEGSRLPKGGHATAGSDAPKMHFGKSMKMASPETNYGQTVWLSLVSGWEMGDDCFTAA